MSEEEKAKKKKAFEEYLKKLKSFVENYSVPQKLYWSTYLHDIPFKTPTVFELPPVPPQDPSTIAETMKQEWNL